MPYLKKSSQFLVWCKCCLYVCELLIYFKMGLVISKLIFNLFFRNHILFWTGRHGATPLLEGGGSLTIGFLV